MVIVKRLVFGVLFILTWGMVLYLLTPLVRSSTNIFSLDLSVLWNQIYLAIALIVAGLFFAIFGLLCGDWWYVLPVAGVSMVAPIIFLPANVSFILSIAALLGELLAFALMKNRLKTYINFDAVSLTLPTVKQFVMIIALGAALVFYSASKIEVDQNSFQIPDSLIDLSLKLSGAPTDLTQIEAVPTQKLDISADQIAQLKKNPQLLQQFGMSPQMLDALSSQTSKPAAAGANLIKQTVKNQVDNMIKPYVGWVPMVLGLLFYLSLTALTSLLMIIVYPLIWLIFYILEQSKFIHFEKEVREVRKLVL